MLSEKRLEKLHKVLGATTGDLDALSVEDLKKRIVGCETELKNVTDEMEANKEFIAAKEVLSDLRSGVAPVKKEMNATIQYCLHLLEEKGQQ